MTPTEFRDFVQEFARWLSNRELDDAAYELRERYARHELARRANQPAATETGPEPIDLGGGMKLYPAKDPRFRLSAEQVEFLKRDEAKANPAPQGAPFVLIPSCQCGKDRECPVNLARGPKRYGCPCGDDACECPRAEFANNPPMALKTCLSAVCPANELQPVGKPCRSCGALVR